MRYIVLTAALACAAATAWGQGRVTGRYMEDRSSRIYACPCEWSSDWVMSGREAVVAWSIEAGEYEGRSLAGLKVAAVLSAESSLSEPATPRSATVFVDAAAPLSKRRAGEAWLRARYGDLVGRVTGVHVAPVDLRFTAETVSLGIGGVLRMEMRRANPATDTETWAALVYEPFVELADAEMGATLKSQYTSPDLKRRWSREETAITGFYGRFSTR